MGVNTPIFPDSTPEVARSTSSRASNPHSAGTHYHQNQDDPPPAYTEYVSPRPQPGLANPRDEQRPRLPHHYNGSTNGYDHAAYNQGSMRQYPSHYPQSHEQHQNFQTPPASKGSEYAITRSPSQNLRKPIVIPATAASLGSPFLRAYPLSLEAFGISRREFLDMLDGLNRVAVQSPPLRALGVAGDILGVVPLGTAQTVGLVVNTAAKLGTIALSKGATEVYLRKVNQETFAPRGLKMEVAKLEGMARVNKLPILDASGKIRDDARLLRPLLDPQEIQTMGAAQRWLRALEPWVEPLDVETLPSVNMDTNLWGRLHTSASERERKNSEKKTLKDRNKALEKHQKGVDKAEERRDRELARLERREQRVLDRHGHRVDDKLRRIDERREKAEMRHHEKIGKVTEDTISKDKEAKAMTKVLWLIIRNLHDDSGSWGTTDISA
ncbi:hypothetical protein F5Y10DRAFT_242964 [Nemania abortiva]|nr:hypothetical protein F5Y10DRAFT_242964 [Nemania abortiva]